MPYIELFKELSGNLSNAHLPLKRVVIGPHIDAEKHRFSVECLLRTHGYSVPVVCSQIPYLSG